MFTPLKTTTALALPQITPSTAMRRATFHLQNGELFLKDNDVTIVVVRLLRGAQENLKVGSTVMMIPKLRFCALKLLLTINR